MGNTYRSQLGFTLLEMAIVIVVISLLLGSFLSPIATEVDHQRMQWTQQQLEEIKRALGGFFVIYKRLPCPAVSKNNGKENITKTSTKIACQSGQQGFLPWITLGVGRYDAWGRPFRYHVASQFTNSEKQKEMLRNQSILEVKDAFYSTQLTNSSSDTHVAAIVLSYGKNDSDDDEENRNNDNLYVMDTKLSTISGKNTGVDDIVTWLSINTLAYYLIATNDWPIQ